jgi:4-amino-4-deoxy-L-arabinose transferase-like glycosyltransferase
VKRGAVLRAWRGHARLGLPEAPRRQEEVGLGVAAAASLWMLLVALWGVNAPFGDGHFAASASIGVAAENIWRHGIPYPLLTYNDSFPSGANYYMHHPLGLYWVMAVLVKVLGAHNWVLRLPAVAYSTLSTVFLYRLGRAIWGPLPGAIAAVAFASLPITLGFSSFHAFEGPVICGLVVASWGYARFTQTWRTSYALVSVAAFFWAANHDFAAYLWAAPFLAWLFLRLFILPARWFGAVEARAAGRYWALMVVAALAALGLLLALVIESGKLPELMRMYGVRSSGNSAPLSTVLRLRHVWITMMFPGLAIAIGKLAFPVVLGRFVVRRDERELLPLWFLILATVQYLHFKQGADVHIFWPQYFAAYFALGAAALAATIQAALVRLRPRLGGRWQALAAGEGAWVAAALVALPVLFVLRDGASVIRLAQESSGRFVSPNIKSDIDRVIAMRWWARGLNPKERIGFHPGIQPVHWGLAWELRPHTLQHSQPLGGQGSSPRFYALDSRFASADELRTAARTFHVEAVGWFWFIDRVAPAAPLDGYSFDEREPGFFQWFFTDNTELHRTVRADPWVTWEWRTLLGQTAPPPTGTPASRDQLRIQHNVAVASGDAAAATRWRAELQRQLNIHPTAKFDDGTELLGGFHSHGAERAVTLYFLAGPSGFKGRSRFSVSSKVERAPRLSTLPKDPETIEIAEPPGIPTDLWKPGQIYSVTFSYRKRPGTERLFGSFAPLDGGRAPAVVGGQRTVDIVTL